MLGRLNFWPHSAAFGRGGFSFWLACGILVASGKVSYEVMRMTTMTTHERFARCFQHKEADCIPIIDSPWAGTLRRWRAEGMPAGVDWEDYFGVDKLGEISVDITPRYAVRILEEDERSYVATSAWGVTMRHFKQEDSTPEFLDFKVNNAEAWAQAKARMTLDDDRINWAYLKENYPRWKAEGRWIRANFWFGFDVAHSWMFGTEDFLVALLEEPELCRDIFETYLNSCIALFGRIWDEGYHFDEIYWPDDMGYKGTPFFSPNVYRELLKPYHKRAVDWAHERGVYAHLHSCGNIMRLLPDIVETGIDALNPIEVKAGMDAIAIKQTYGDKLTLHGGINAVLWDKRDAILAEIEQLVPALKQNGGFIFSSDHSIPNSVSLQNFREIVAAVKRAGSY